MKHYIPNGIVQKALNTLPKNVFNLEKWLKKTLSYFNVSLFDPCCSNNANQLPLRYNSETSTIEYYNGTWTNTNISVYNPYICKFTLEVTANNPTPSDITLDLLEFNSFCSGTISQPIVQSINNNNEIEIFFANNCFEDILDRANVLLTGGEEQGNGYYTLQYRISGSSLFIKVNHINLNKIHNGYPFISVQVTFNI